MMLRHGIFFQLALTQGKIPRTAAAAPQPTYTLKVEPTIILYYNYNFFNNTNIKQDFLTKKRNHFHILQLIPWIVMIANMAL